MHLPLLIFVHLLSQLDFNSEPLSMGTRCRRTGVLRHNCAHKTQNGKMLKRSAERVLRRHKCVIPIGHKIKIHFVLEDLSEDPTQNLWGPLGGPENSVDPTQNLSRSWNLWGPADLRTWYIWVRGPDIFGSAIISCHIFINIGGPNTKT